MQNELMKLNQHERRLLKILAEEWEKSGPPGYVETSKIAAHLAISIADAKSAIRSLFVKGMVDTDQVDTFAAYLTPEGYELARKDEDDNAIG
jgi:Mn-dependent DtxR family transcriptional regulator